MEYEKYLITFSFQKNRRDYYYFDQLLEFLEANKQTLQIKSVSLHNSSLVNHCFTYIFQTEGLNQNLIGTLVNFEVIKLTQDHPPFEVDELLDEAIKDCVMDVEGRAYSLCFYLVEKEGRIQFHRFSRFIEDGVTTDDDHMEEMEGIISSHPDIFFQEFYEGDNYNAEDTAFLAKLLLTVDDGIEYDF